MAPAASIRHVLLNPANFTFLCKVPLNFSETPCTLFDVEKPFKPLPVNGLKPVFTNSVSCWNSAGAMTPLDTVVASMSKNGSVRLRSLMPRPPARGSFQWQFDPCALSDLVPRSRGCRQPSRSPGTLPTAASLQCGLMRRDRQTLFRRRMRAVRIYSSIPTTVM